jgi:pimeloyl-ACP methyl ester carboxylesterase
MTTRRSVFSSDGVPIVYDVQGRGPDTVVFVHGWTCNRSHWQAQMEAFPDRYRTIAIDLGGHGESGTERTEWTMPSLARDVAAVLDQEMVEKAVVVGHSMGGRVMVHVAEQLGHRIVGLVGADTLKFVRSHSMDGYVKTIRALESDYAVAARGFVESMFTGDTPESVRATIAEGMIRTPAAVGIGAMTGMMNDDGLPGLIEGLNIPFVVINSHGSSVDTDGAGELGLSIQFVTTKGHFVMNEDPETFNRLLGEALEKMF